MVIVNIYLENNSKELSGFSLIELIFIIIIIGILVIVSLPIYFNLKTMAIEKSEDVIVAALYTAIKTKYLENVSNGMSSEDAWPCQDENTNPFDLLENPPPNTSEGKFWESDGTNWKLYWGSIHGDPYWHIACPHYNFNLLKGRVYNYISRPDTWWPGNEHKQGDFWKNTDFGH